MAGLQIYTIRSLLTDYESSVEALSEIKNFGYENVQLSGDIDYARTVAKAARSVGLSVSGYLASKELLLEHYDDVVSILKKYGGYDVGVSGFETTEEGATNFAKEMNGVAEKLKADGFSFSYHNHSLEFLRTESGNLVMDVLLREFDTDLVGLMPDTYWLWHGGMDVSDFIKKLGRRVKILHLKDMKRTLDGVTFAELGCGNLDIKGFVKTALSVGINDFVIEQDSSDISPLDAAKIGICNLKRILSELN
jgi:sugar phosphate isomerase/epimerase